jgi:hypothetical protein
VAPRTAKVSGVYARRRSDWRGVKWVTGPLVRIMRQPCTSPPGNKILRMGPMRLQPEAFNRNLIGKLSSPPVGRSHSRAFAVTTMVLAAAWLLTKIMQKQTACGSGLCMSKFRQRGRAPSASLLQFLRMTHPMPQAKMARLIEHHATSVQALVENTPPPAARLASARNVSMLRAGCDLIFDAGGWWVLNFAAYIVALRFRFSLLDLICSASWGPYIIIRTESEFLMITGSDRTDPWRPRCPGPTNE